jgi:hypothetical protein
MAMVVLASAATALALPSLGTAAARQPHLVQVSAGFFSTCGVLSDGRLSCWSNGDFSNATIDGLTYPPSGIGTLDVPAGRFRQVDARNPAPCAVRVDGRVVCFAVRRRDSTSAALPPGRYASVAGFYTAVCGIRTDRRLRCSTVIDNIGRPIAPPELPRGRFTQLGVGAQFGCALGVDRRIRCWGASSRPPEGRFRALDATGSHACAISMDARLRCWTRTGSRQHDAAFEPLPDGRYRQVSTGGRFTCALTVRGEARCWGAGGELGQTDAPDGRYVAISAGTNHACAITTTGRLRCWGGRQP